MSLHTCTHSSGTHGQASEWGRNTSPTRNASLQLTARMPIADPPEPAFPALRLHGAQEMQRRCDEVRVGRVKDVRKLVAEPSDHEHLEPLQHQGGGFVDLLLRRVAFSAIAHEDVPADGHRLKRQPLRRQRPTCHERQAASQHLPYQKHLLILLFIVHSSVCYYR